MLMLQNLLENLANQCSVFATTCLSLLQVPVALVPHQSLRNREKYENLMPQQEDEEEAMPSSSPSLSIPLIQQEEEEVPSSSPSLSPSIPLIQQEEEEAVQQEEVPSSSPSLSIPLIQQEEEEEVPSSSPSLSIPLIQQEEEEAIQRMAGT